MIQTDFYFFLNLFFEGVAFVLAGQVRPNPKPACLNTRTRGGGQLLCCSGVPPSLVTTLQGQGADRWKSLPEG